VKPAAKYYVSLGDSYAVGYQPGKLAGSGGATSGYAGYVAAETGLKLVNFGCAGATTTSILNEPGCSDVLAGEAGEVNYSGETQAKAAEGFIASHRGEIGLITVSIGGNDVTSCAKAANAIDCVEGVVGSIRTNVAKLAEGLRAAVGKGVAIIGLTYPDVILGTYVYPKDPGSPAAVSLAQESVVAFKALINPALKKAYALGGASFVDVTAASGSYIGPSQG
jgi:lysophospholipase L1-like esterase